MRGENNVKTESEERSFEDMNRTEETGIRITIL
jgi:hypothetical protein